VKWIYKKTDSVLRGQVTAELEAILKELGYHRALLLPANPALGRTICDGRYFIHGKAINRTDFARDPEHPRRSANVLRLLAQSKRIPIRVLQRGDAFPADGILIGEVSSPADVKRWVARFEPDMLLSGGAETFAAALQAAGFKSTKPKRVKPSTPPGGELFVCGSTSDACREFVNQSRRQAISTIGLSKEIALRNTLPRTARRVVAECVSDAVRTKGRAILHVGLPVIGERIAARRLAKNLAELAAEVLQRCQIRHLFVEGGETAAALLRQMGWVRLRVLRELSPGVATLEPVGGAGVWLTIKPGSYRWPAGVSSPS
jgi:uncharacterized protein YgbK (DUF1537 family)